MVAPEREMPGISAVALGAADDERAEPGQLAQIAGAAAAP